MATSYEIIYKRFLQKITDFNLMEIDDFSLDEMLKGWLKSAIVRTRTTEPITLDNENEVFVEDLSELNIELLSMGMILAWLDQYLNSTENVLQFIGGKEEKLRQIIAFSSLQ